jgi:hypothetical protein
VTQQLERKSAYDPAYIVLADELNATLWTVDGPLARNAEPRGLPVRLIETPCPAHPRHGEHLRARSKAHIGALALINLPKNVTIAISWLPKRNAIERSDLQAHLEGVGEHVI